MKIRNLIPRLVLIGLGLAVALLFVPGANAGAIYDFSCGSGSCTGSVSSLGGGNYAGSGITLTGSQDVPPAPFDVGDNFTLTFNSSTGAISIVENQTPTDVLAGTITGFSSSISGGIQTIHVGVSWTTIPPDMLGLSGITPYPSGSVVDLRVANGQVTSVDIPVNTPEPASLALLVAGLAGLGLLRKRIA